MTQPPAGGYPPPHQPPQGGNYPPPGSSSGYPPPASGASPAGGYPPPSGPGAYPPPSGPGGYGPPAGGAYPPPGGYPPPSGPGAAASPYPQPGAAPGQSYPPPAAPAGWNPPPGSPSPYGGGAPTPSGGPQFKLDTSNVKTGDWIILGSGLILLIFSFFGWLSSSFTGAAAAYGSGDSAGAWHEYWWIATVLGVGVAVVAALRLFAGQALSQIQPVFLVAAAALGALITLIALIEIFSKTSGVDVSDTDFAVSVGPGFAIWVCLIVALVQTYVVWLWAQRQPGWKLPKLPGPANL